MNLGNLVRLKDSKDDKAVRVYKIKNGMVYLVRPLEGSYRWPLDKLEVVAQ